MAKQLTVLQILPELQSGGVERGTLEMARYLKDRGHNSHVVSAGGRLVETLVSEGSCHHQLEVAAKSHRSLMSVLPFRRLLGRINPDIVHVRSRVPGWVTELAFKLIPEEKRPVRISTFHGFYSINKYSAVMTRGKRIIAVSDTISAHIRTEYQVSADRITTIPRGVDPSVFDPSSVSKAERDQLRNQWHAGESDTPVLLMPGRFTRLKGHHMLIDALSELSELPWVLVLLGDHLENKSYTDELVKHAGDCGIKDHLRFPGHTDQMALSYAASDLVLNTSTTPESFGRTAVEAMAMEKPVVVSGHGGSMETVLNDKTGWMFTPGNTGSLTDVLQTALQNKNRWADMGRVARRHVTESFTLEKMCSDTLDVYLQESSI